ncbi:MAG: lysophospholipid acyltransferase family protein [Saprospiraceae bacterium]
MLSILGYRIYKHGQFEQITPAIYISNHRCFSDPILALCYFDFLPMGKAEIENYPLIGYGAKITGILFVKRDDKTSRHKAIHAMKEALQQGISVFLCPEGTTNVGQTTKEFKKGAFEVSCELKVPIVPLAMVYHDPAKDFWLPGNSLVQHFVRQFGAWRTTVDVYFPEKSFSDTDPVLLKQACKNWIDEKLMTVKVPEEIAALAVYNLKV